MAVSEKTFSLLSNRVGLFCHDTNIGVVLADSGIVLVDSGPTEEDGQLAVSALATLFPDKKVTASVQTHPHGDHCSGSLWLQDAGVEIWASAETAAVMQVPTAVTSVYCGGRAVEQFDIPAFTLRAPVNTARVLGGEVVDLGAVSLKTIDLPGHFFGQTGVLVSEKTGDKESCKRVFFLGDALFGEELLSKTWIPFMTDPAAFRESAAKIAATPADFYVPAHGKPCDKTQINACVEMNQMTTLEVEALLLKILSEKPCTAEELLKAVADFSSIKLKVIPYFLITTTLNSYLASLQHEGKVSCEITDNRLLWKKTEGI